MAGLRPGHQLLQISAQPPGGTRPVPVRALVTAAGPFTAFPIHKPLLRPSSFAVKPARSANLNGVEAKACVTVILTTKTANM